MPYSTAAKNLMLNALRAAGGITHVSAHTANPGDTGANEVTGGSYARQPIAFNPASAGTMDDSTNGAAIPIPAGTTVTHLGFWSAATAGTFHGYSDVPDEVFNSAGWLNVTDTDLDLSL